MKVSKLYSFEAAHILPRHPGPCNRMHGHSFRVQVELSGAVNNATGFVLDFADLDSVVEPLVRRLDHRLLNCFMRYPSSENIAFWFAHELQAKLTNIATEFDRMIVKVSETAKSWAEWDSDSPSDTMALLSDVADLGWKTPDTGLKGGDKVMEMLGMHKIQAMNKLNAYLHSLTIVEQLQLYIDSMDDDPVLPKMEKESDITVR